MHSAQRFKWWALIGTTLALVSLHAHAAGLPGPMVDAQWLHGHLDDVTVVDVRGQPQSFTAPPRYRVDKEGKKRLIAVGGHIPGARLIDFNDVRTTRKIDGREIRFMLPSAFEFESIMRDAGVDSDKPLVIVSPGDSTGTLDTAARLYWTLKTLGSTDVAILNGGMAAWLQAGYEISTDPAQPMPGNWTARDASMHWSADSSTVAQAHGNGIQLVDARPVPQFLGISKSKVVHDYGHINGARNFPTDAIVRKDGDASYFMTKAEYKKILPELGIDAAAPTITYCNTGHLAAGAWFVIHEIVGNEQTRLYDGSMLEWTQEGRPVVP